MIKRFLNAAHQAWFQQRKRGLRQRILETYRSHADPEVRQTLAFVENHPGCELPLGMTPPCEWANEYQPGQVQVFHDDPSGLPYIHHRGHRVFFPRERPESEIQTGACIGLMEQDPRSPHAYVGRNFGVDDGDAAVFIGASDGLFSSSLMPRLSKAYLFEPDASWHETLRATFAPWGGKVEILPLAVGSVDKPGFTSLDTFFHERPLPNYIQMDVEGFEQDVLNGAQRVLRTSPKLRLSICTYHKRQDFARFSRQLRRIGYAIGHAPGFYILGVRPPYFRRGVLHAMRKSA